MKNKIIIVTVFAMASAVLLTGCIVVNVEKSTPSNSCASGMSKGGSTTNAPAGSGTNNISQ